MGLYVCTTAARGIAASQWLLQRR